MEGLFMFKALLRKKKSNKGFTLIELIVVIAILAILALLLVPRFMGFTDRAKVQADEAAMETIEKAVTALLATNEITYSTSVTSSITIPDTGAFVVTSVTPVAASPTVQERIQSLIGTNHNAQTGTGFEVNITTGGAVSVAVTR